MILSRNRHFGDVAAMRAKPPRMLVASDGTRPACDRPPQSRAGFRDLMMREVNEKSTDLASFETIRRIAILPRDLTIEDGELSPTLKVKRRVVEKKYADLIESAYAPLAGVRA